MTRAANGESGGGLVIDTLQPEDCILSTHGDLPQRAVTSDFQRIRITALILAIQGDRILTKLPLASRWPPRCLVQILIVMDGNRDPCFCLQQAAGCE